MIQYILDTDVLTLIQQGHREICERFLQEPHENVAITILSVEEQLSGWCGIRNYVKRNSPSDWPGPTGVSRRISVSTRECKLSHTKRMP